MKKHNLKDSFWTSYSDLMTSLFFVMLVLFIISLIKFGKEIKHSSDAERTVDSLLEAKDREKAIVDSLLAEANVTIAQQKQILQLEEQFQSLSRSSSLCYNSEKRIFYAKDFEGKEIFYSNDDRIKKEYLGLVDKVGNDLQRILEGLNNDKFHYQLVIEGNAAIKWKQLKRKAYDPDSREMYFLCYRRALALYNRWRLVGKHDFRKYNTEVIIAGSGFNGNNRDQRIEENNKRFVIQIIPKINRPDNH